jgi:hypothetical protein
MEVKEKNGLAVVAKNSSFLGFFLSQSPPNHNPITFPSSSIYRLQDRQTHSFLPLLASTRRHQNQEMRANYWSQYWFLCEIASSVPLGHPDGDLDKAICFVYCPWRRNHAHMLQK